MEGLIETSYLFQEFFMKNEVNEYCILKPFA